MQATNDKHIVVVTGAAGCLGHHVLRMLLAKDDQCVQVRCIDLQRATNLQRSYLEAEVLKLSPNKKINVEHEYENEATTASETKQLKVSSTVAVGKAARNNSLQHMRKPSAHGITFDGEQSEQSAVTKIVRWFKGDIRDINLVERCLDGADCIVHCAARIEATVYYTDQAEDELESVNVNGTENLLRAAVRFGVPQFIHVSSFEAWLGYGMIYHATETTLPLTDCLIYGASGMSKREAARKVQQYSNNILERPAKNGQLFLNAVVLDFPQMYGEFDNHYITKIIKVAKFFNNKLPKITNIWTRQQPIYAGNAAWAVIAAKKRMQNDKSISGENFIITDDTKIDEPYKFVKPYLECAGASVSQSRISYFPLWCLMSVFFCMYKLIRAIDIFNLTDNKLTADEQNESNELKKTKLRWYHYVNPQIISIMCITCFFNRAKAILRLDYEPLFTADEAKKRSLQWYEKHCSVGSTQL